MPKRSETSLSCIRRSHIHTNIFTSHHPLHQKLGVIKTLLDRCNNIRTRKQRERGGAHHQRTRKMWEPKLDHKEGERTAISEGKKKRTQKNHGMVTLPYDKGVTEHIQRILKHHEIGTSVRPHQNIRRMLVHPKDKVEDSKKTDCVYQIPCKSCNY